MESQLVGWIISLITGGVGGNIAGAVLKNLSLGPLGNTIAGVVGGGLGGQILTALLGSGGAPPGILGNVAGSGVGGIVVMAVVGLIKNAMAKKS
ncbi:MAG TPA: hypothetical protein VK695_08620 [Steroidobacteraceae bacterium]|jgi:uncharacterized membrane protein YeaQ/YmgE (transglycosylase-associated protein family)|nr:hypothetical protein [Steroidobacteraceae bacterium]